MFGIDQNNCVDPEARAVLQAYAHSKDEALVKFEKIKAEVQV
jgi:hypothetical protein